MEWSRIKNILIIALVLTNIFLIYMIISGNDDDDKAVNSTTFDETMDVLEMNGITVSCDTDIPLSKMPALTLTFDNKNGYSFYTIDPNDYTELNEKTAKKMAESFIKKHSEYKDISKELVFEASKPFESETGLLTYSVSFGGYFDDYRMTDCYLICYVTPYGVSSIERHWTVASKSAEAFEPVPLSEALLAYIADASNNGESIKNQEIVDISLVYSVATQVGENVSSDTAFPTWKITTDRGLVHKVPAYKLT